MLVALLFFGEITLKIILIFPNYASFFFKIIPFEKIANKSKKYIFLIRSRWSTRKKRNKSTMKFK